MLDKQTIRRLSLSLFLTLGFVIFEAAAGILGNSLALLSDAGHNLTDVIALGLSWYAMRISAQPATGDRTYGYHRAGILTALLNSTTLVFVAGYIFYEAYQRFMHPPQVNSDILISVGLVAFVINAVTAWLVYRGSERDLNLRSAFVHLMGDVFSTIGAIAAGIVIAFTGLNWIDPVISVLIGLLILWNAWGILRETVEILLESTPRDVDMKKLVESILQVEGVKGVHDLHVWSLTRSYRALSAHLLTEDVSISQGADIQRAVSGMIQGQFNVGHATLQLECVDCGMQLLHCNFDDEMKR
jgi:cobalt-zinc-cadmium efflux system protein